MSKPNAITRPLADIDNLGELQSETRQTLEDRKRRPISREQARTRLGGQRERLAAVLASSLDERLHDLATRPEPDPDLMTAALAALASPEHPYWLAVEAAIAASDRLRGDDPDDDAEDERLHGVLAEIDRELVLREAERDAANVSDRLAVLTGGGR